MAFDGAIGPGRGEGRIHGRAVHADTVGENHEGRELALFGGDEPGPESRDLSVGDDLMEALDQNRSPVPTGRRHPGRLVPMQCAPLLSMTLGDAGRASRH